MRTAELFGEDDADLGEPLIVGLQTGEHDVELVAFHRGGQRVGGHEGIGAREAFVVDMDGAVGAARERFADDLRHPRRACRADHDLAAMLLLQAQGLFERIGVRFVHFESRILLANPGFRIVEAGLPLPGGDLLDADSNLHLSIW